MKIYYAVIINGFAERVAEFPIEAQSEEEAQALAEKLKTDTYTEYSDFAVFIDQDRFPE